MRQCNHAPPAPPVLCAQTGVLCGRLGLDELLAAGRRGWCCRTYLEEAIGYADDAGEEEPPEWLGRAS